MDIQTARDVFFPSLKDQKKYVALDQNVVRFLEEHAQKRGLSVNQLCSAIITQWAIGEAQCYLSEDDAQVEQLPGRLLPAEYLVAELEPEPEAEKEVEAPSLDNIKELISVEIQSKVGPLEEKIQELSQEIEKLQNKPAPAPAPAQKAPDFNPIVAAKVILEWREDLRNLEETHQKMLKINRENLTSEEKEDYDIKVAVQQIMIASLKAFESFGDAAKKVAAYLKCLPGEQQIKTLIGYVLEDPKDRYESFTEFYSAFRCQLKDQGMTVNDADEFDITLIGELALLLP